MSDTWYYADRDAKAGPFSLAQLREALLKLQNPRGAFVWCGRFPDWVRAYDVPELKATLPPPLPRRQPSAVLSELPTWRVPSWWYFVGGLCLVGLSSIGNGVGRAEMGRVSLLRVHARRARKT